MDGSTASLAAGSAFFTLSLPTSSRNAGSRALIWARNPVTASPPSSQICCTRESWASAYCAFAYGDIADRACPLGAGPDRRRVARQGNARLLRVLLPTRPSGQPLLSLPAHSLWSKALDQSTADALRRSTEEYLRRRKTKLLIIDEAQHMLLVGGQQRLECQFECLKSLTIETGVTILLVGTYRLLEILDQSGQLTRRSQVINFPRYDMRKKDDRNHFKQVLKHCEHELSKYVPTRLEEHADYFYTKSAGCIGILKDWLCRCLEYALQEKMPCLDAALATRFAHSNRGLVTIIEEACLGEAKLADVDDAKLTDLLANGVLLGTGTPSARGKHRPGRRNPTRDPVGVSA